MDQLLSIVFTHVWDQLVLNHANSKNIVVQRFAGLIHPVELRTLFSILRHMPNITNTVGIYCLENAHLSVILCAFDDLI
jgi:hypothetical protein